MGPAIVGVCLMIAAAIGALGIGNSAEGAGLGEAMDETERLALASQSTLRLAARSCGSLVRGSAFVVGDVMLTNAHLVVGASEAKVDQPISPVLRSVIHRPPGLDLAILSAPEAIGLVLSERDAQAGEDLLIAGHGGGGVVQVRRARAVGRVDGTAYGYDSDVLLIEATSSGGFSGGPVIDVSGDVVGVLQGFDQATGLTIAIPSALVRDALADWEASEADSTEGRSGMETAADCG